MVYIMVIRTSSWNTRTAETSDATRPPLYLLGLKAKVSREEL
jgi:hypothetical protein